MEVARLLSAPEEEVLAALTEAGQIFLQHCRSLLACAPIPDHRQTVAAPQDVHPHLVLDLGKVPVVSATEVDQEPVVGKFQKGLDGLPLADVRTRLAQIERTLDQWSGERKLYGPRFDDILKLKYLHQRYTNYKSWLEQKS